MRVLGIDPGTAITGYGVVEEVGGDLRPLTFGVIRTPADRPLPVRLRTIYQAVKALVTEWEPAAAAVEELFFSSNVRTAMSVGQARGVVLLALADAGLTVAEYTPLAVKQAVTGYGNADKAQMQEMVRLLLGLAEVPRPDDAADALAVAICHLHSARLTALSDASSPSSRGAR
ncbi:MAG: crossover junction endodeoxyribonuclease RuvC [Chloroflexi bacterium]|nr:MAG: crossover junction endodeoxyribonuclease RuvC [Chloroflexota bacterium]RLC86848.1 MAG: crossover junction endodeoxyribonuclease RuvC [Chloroflexota bacterium]HEY68913.1 crossover junction endodeoxyribonuclease RuvC [Thermoflexia bacterium]